MPTTTNYGFYTPPLTGVTPNVPRDSKTLADAVDAALKAEETARIAGDVTMFSSQAVASAATTLGTTVTDITGMTVSVTVGSSAEVYMVSLVFDVNTLTTGGGTFIGRLNVGGTEASPQALWAPGGATSLRAMVAQTYRVTGVGPGTVVFKATATGSVASVYRVNSQHSTLTILRVA